MISLCVDGLGTRQRGDCDANKADGEWRRSLSPILARRRFWALPHLWGWILVVSYEMSLKSRLLIESHSSQVHLVSEHIWCDDYLIRSFYLKNLKTSETRTVTQFHFLSWPENGVPPSIKALLEFRRWTCRFALFFFVISFHLTFHLFVAAHSLLYLLSFSSATLAATANGLLAETNTLPVTHPSFLWFLQLFSIINCIVTKVMGVTEPYYIGSCLLTALLEKILSRKSHFLPFILLFACLGRYETNIIIVWCLLDLLNDKGLKSG